MRDLQSLLDLLAAERAALRAGDYARLGDLEQQKESLSRGILSCAPDDWPEAARALRRNHRLLGAALAGVRAGAGRLDLIRAGAAGFSAYAADGSAAVALPSSASVTWVRSLASVRRTSP